MDSDHASSQDFRNQSSTKPSPAPSTSVPQAKKVGKPFPRWLKLSLVAAAMTLIVLIVSVVLQIVMYERNQQDDELTGYTSSNVGGAVTQMAPSLNAIDADGSLFESLSMEKEQVGMTLTTEMIEEYVENTNLVSTNGDVRIQLDLKKRGLRYEPTYTTEFTAVYVLKNSSDKEVAVEFEFPFPQNVLNKEINNAMLLVDGEEQEKPVRIEEDEETPAGVEYDYSYGYEYYDDCYGEYCGQTAKSSMYWEGTIAANGQREIEVRYNTVGLGEFSYSGMENPEGSQDFQFLATILGTRKYDNLGSLTIDSREYITEDGKNGVVLQWDKPNLFSSPELKISIASRVNPSRHLSEIYKIMVPLYVGFAGALLMMVILHKKEFGGVDLVLVSVLFTIFFPFLHYLVSFNIDPSADVLSDVSKVIEFSMPLYVAFVVALGVIGSLILYLLARVSGTGFAFAVGLPLIVVFMAFFPLAMTLPEYKYLLVLIGVVAILAILVQMRVTRKLTRVANM